MKKELLPVISGITVSMIFGFSFLFTKKGLEFFTPFHLLSLRFAFASICLLLLHLTKIIRVDFRGKKVSSLILLSCVQPVLYFIFETYGLKHSTSLEAGIMIALIPIVVAIMAYFFLREKVNIKQLLFIAISFLGVMLIVIFKSTSSFGGSITGILFLLGAVISGGFYNILSRKSSSNFTPIEITFVMMNVGAVVFTCISLTEFISGNNLYGYVEPLLKPEAILSVTYLGVLSSIVAFFLVNFMLSKLEATKSSIFGYLTTVISVIAGVSINGERLEWYHIFGCVFIIMGIWGTNYFGRKLKNPIDLEKRNF